jgi:hypothetical protein
VTSAISKIVGLVDIAKRVVSLIVMLVQYVTSLIVMYRNIAMFAVMLNVWIDDTRQNTDVGSNVMCVTMSIVTNMVTLHQEKSICVGTSTLEVQFVGFYIVHLVCIVQ